MKGLNHRNMSSFSDVKLEQLNMKYDDLHNKKEDWFVGSKPQENMKFQQYKIRIAEHEI